MSFNLRSEVAALDYDFGGGIKGTVPEPSRKAAVRFSSRIADAILKAGRDITDRSDMDEMSRIMADMTEDEMQTVAEETFDAVVELCQGHPSADELESIGHRGFQAFLGWLAGEVRNPEGSKPATKR